MSTFDPDFDLDLDRGRVKEELARRLLTIDNDHLTVETKGDYVAERTGNHYIEVQQRGRNGRWRDSGVRTTTADYWAVALPNGVVVFVPVARVRALAEAAVDAGNTREMARGDNPTVGAIVPLSRLVA